MAVASVVLKADGGSGSVVLHVSFKQSAKASALELLADSKASAANWVSALNFAAIKTEGDAMRHIDKVGQVHLYPLVCKLYFVS